MQPRIYTYKITFEEVPYWYWGVHKEKRYGEPYYGSPKTHSWVWEFYSPKIQILEFFPNTDQGWVEARNVEDRLIKPDLNNPLCLNEAYSGVKSIETCRKAGKVGGKMGDKEGKRKSGTRARDAKTGIHAPGVASIGGLTTKERHPDHFSTAGKVGAAVQHKQLWKCLDTGHITTPGPLSRYQKARGIDTALRERVK
jgi:hypothetical protein